MKYKIKAIRKIKYIFYRFGVHRLLPASSLSFVGHLSSLSKWISQHRDIPFTSFPVKKFDYRKRYDLYQYVIDNEVKTDAIDYMEFGVAEGHSFKWWTEQIKNEDTRFYGFDTFTGLPEDWGPFKKGDMSNGNEPPKLDDNRCQFYQGIFQTSLYDFLKERKLNRKKVILLDADLYSSTLFVLSTLSPYLVSGDIILFDEFNVPLHEYKAFKDWVASFYIDYELIGEVNNYYQIAIRIK